MIRPRYALAVLAAVLSMSLAAGHAAAQIVNTQPLLAKVGEEGFAGELGASIDWRTGNVELLRVIGSLLMLYKDGDHTLISSTSGDYGTKSGDEFIARVFSHLRYQVWLSELITWEVFGQVSTAKFTRLNFRGLAGTGPRWDLVPGPNVSLSVGTAYMFEREVLNDTDFADSGRTDNNHRLSMYVTGRFSLTDFVTLIHTTYWQPRFDAFVDDFRIFSDTDIAFQISDSGLALTLGFDLAYDSEPPIDVNDLDTTLTFGITWGF